MPKKSKSSDGKSASPLAAEAKATTRKSKVARSAAKKSAATSAAKAARAARTAKKADGRKKSTSHLALSLPLAKARKLAGDLYQAAGLALWAEAIESAREPERGLLIQLQDAVCDVADLLREARATNPKHLKLYWVACLDREGLPTTPPHFVTATNEEEAVEIFRAAFKDEIGRRKPRARLAPTLAEQPQLHD
jgi:hypothetical protein